METIVSIIILLVVVGLLWKLVLALGLPAPIGEWVNIAFIVLLILLLLGFLFGGLTLPVLNLHLR